MATIRDAVTRALLLLKATAPGDDPTADELAEGLRGAQALILEIHEARGPLLTRDITGNTTPGENQRLRVQAGSTVSVTLPNSVAISDAYDPDDYGFDPGIPCDGAANPPVGSTGAADGIAWRQPTDGARIEIVGTQQGLYFYRADTNAWMPALGLALDTEQPLNQRLQPAFEALLAERLADVFANADQLTPAQRSRLSKAHELLFSRPGAGRRPVRAQYL
jgi:hypothetical protein